MKLDRTRQRRILETLAATYPKRVSIQTLTQPSEQADDLIPDLYYLQEHGLIEAGLKPIYGKFVWGAAHITAKGMDFLEDDGGLSAILGTVTVRFHADTLRALLVERIAESDAPPEQKSRLARAIETASEESLKTTVNRLTDLALARLPDAIGLLQTLLTPAA